MVSIELPRPIAERRKQPVAAITNGNTKPSRFQFAAIITAVILIGCLLIYLVAKPGKPPLDFGVLPSVLQWAQGGINVNFVGQRVAHKLLVLSLGLCILCVPPLYSKFGHRIAQNRFMHPINAAGILFFLLSLYFWHDKPWCLLVGSFSTAALLFYRPSPWQRTNNTLALGLIGLASMMLLPGLFAPIDWSSFSPDRISDFQSHYSTVVLQGDRVAAGQQLFREVKAYYGIALTVASGVLEARLGEIQIGNYVVAIKLFQCLFFALCVILYKRFARGFNYAAIAAALMILPWLHPTTDAIWYPNLSFSRMLCFPVSLLLIYALRKISPVRSAITLGAVAGLCSLVNLETSVAATGGMITYLFLRYCGVAKSRIFSFSGLLFSFLVAWVVPWILLMSGWKLITGQWPDLSSYVNTFKHISKLIDWGYLSLPMHFLPTSLVVLGLAVFVFIRSACLSESSDTHRNAFRSAVAAMIVVWSTYYVNRPDMWTLAPLFPLFAILLIDMIRAIQIGLRRNGPPAVHGTGWATAILGLVIFPQIAYGFELTSESYVKGLQSLGHHPSAVKTRLLSGIYVDRKLGDVLVSKSNFVQELAKTGPVAYITTDCAFVPKLSGVLSSIPTTDTFQELNTGEKLLAFCSELNERAPQQILIDDHKASPTMWYRELSFNMIRAKLSEKYVLSEHAAGWEIWVRKGT